MPALKWSTRNNSDPYVELSCSTQTLDLVSEVIFYLLEIYSLGFLKWGLFGLGYFSKRLSLCLPSCTRCHHSWVSLLAHKRGHGLLFPPYMLCALSSIMPCWGCPTKCPHLASLLRGQPESVLTSWSERVLTVGMFPALNVFLSRCWVLGSQCCLEYKAKMNFS